LHAKRSFPQSAACGLLSWICPLGQMSMSQEKKDRT
jgi:hypothetical protein